MKVFRNLCLWLMLTAVLVMPVLAAGAGVTLEASVATANAGDTFTVEAIFGGETVALGTVALDYDEKVFALVSGKCLLENAMFGEVLLQEKAGTFLLMLPRKISGPVFSFEFRVKSNVAPGKYEIGAEASFGDSKGSNVDVKGVAVQVVTKTAEAPTDKTPAEPKPTEQVAPPTTDAMPTEPKPTEQVVPPTTEKTSNATEITPTTEETRREEPDRETEQTQPVSPNQNQQQTIVTTYAAPTDEIISDENTEGRWWVLIPLVIACGIAIIATRKKKKD